MKISGFQSYPIKVSISACLLTSTSTSAQIIPDSNLPNNSKVINSGNVSTISGGTQASSNLFHSFEQFSVPTGGTAYFNNAADIQNIISRVTGKEISNIDGLVRANGTANLFLINPNGIIFGPNASLNIGGSFVAGTASSLNFADRTQFSATTPQTTPLLTVSIPIGLQFGDNPGAIRVQGNGHNLSLGFSSIKRSSFTEGLRVQPVKTLALLGGDVILEGGNLVAEGGRIELGSVGSGLVSFSPTTTGLTFSYGGMPNFRDITLSRQALVDVSGTSAGSVQVQGANVMLTDGSVILNQNQGVRPSGSLKVNASESLELSGTSPNGRIPSILRTETVRAGDGGDIEISTRQLIIQDGSGISSRVFSTAKGGNLNLNVSEFTQLLGFSPFNPLITSNISASTSSAGNAGNITLSTRQLTLRDGGTVSSLTRGSGSGGDVIVNAANAIEITTSEGLINSGLDHGPSVLSATAFSGGTAGSLRIDTRKLLVGNGAIINTSTLGTRAAGSVTINALDSVEVEGGAIGSSAIKADATTQELFASPPEPSGPSGDVTIKTGQFRVADGGVISVKNEGSSSAGVIRINANSINIDNQGVITAATASSRGGEIYLQAQDFRLQNGSTITATAGSPSLENNQVSENSTDINGGNISISTSTLAARENSKIDANAVQGNGGNISIDTDKSAVWKNSNINANATQGNGGNVNFSVGKLASLQNSKFSANATQGNGGNFTINASNLIITRNSAISANAVLGNGGIININTQGLFIKSPDSSITANSQYGFNGVVQITGVTTQPASGLINHRVQLRDEPKLFAQGCAGGDGGSVAQQSSFVVTGSGGLPAPMGSPLTSNALIINGKSPESSDNNHLAALRVTPQQLVEATGWVINDQGEVVLTEQSPGGTMYSSNLANATCYAP